MNKSKILTPQFLIKLRNSFDIFDEDDDFYINSKYIEKALRLSGLNPSFEEIQDILNELEGREISFSSFIYIAYKHSRYCNVEKELYDSFFLFDKKQTGFLSLEIIKKILKNIKRPFLDEQIELILNNRIIKNNLVDYKSFINSLINL